jgi:hypothetical protein
MPTWLDKGLPSAGVYAGPVAFLVAIQANYALVPWACAHHVRLVPLVALGLAAASLAGGILSWRAYRQAGGPNANPAEGGQPNRLTALIGIGMAAFFAIIIVFQGAAGIVLDGCER